MGIFKSIDNKFSDIGFVKIREDEYGADYERHNADYGYTQKLALIKKQSGRHIVQSYNTNLFDSKGIGCTCVGLSMYEMKLCLKKMKEMGWKSIKQK